MTQTGLKDFPLWTKLSDNDGIEDGINIPNEESSLASASEIFETVKGLCISYTRLGQKETPVAQSSEAGLQMINSVFCTGLALISDSRA